MHSEINTELYVELSRAAHSVCRQIVERYAHEGIYSFNFYTHPLLSYVVDNFSTEVGFQKVAKEYIRRGHRFDLAEIRWSPPDSPYHAMFSDQFAAAGELLNEHWRNMDAMSDEEHDCKYVAARSTFVEVLIDIRNQCIFDRSVVLNFVCGDQSNEERMVSAQHINYPDVVEKYQSGIILDIASLSAANHYWNER